MQYQFLLNNLNKSDELQAGLMATGIRESDIHFVTETNKDYAGHHVHEASIFEERDLLHSGLRFAAVGAAIGLVISAICYYVQPYGWQFGMINFLFMMALTTGFGGWTGGLFGIAHRNYRISDYENDLKNGKAIMLVYTDEEHADKAKQIVQSTESDSRYLGKDSAFDNPMKNHKLEELED
jgi:hypothetical protein